MGRFFRCDLKRIFSSRATLILCIAVPLAVMLIFTSVIVPRFVAQSRVEASCFAVCNEDGTVASREFINYVAGSKTLRDVVYILSVDTKDEGMKLVEDGEVSGMLYIPPNFYAEMREGKDVKVDLYGTAIYQLECSLVVIAVENALDMVGRGQNALDAIRAHAVDLGADEAAAEEFYNEMVLVGTQMVTDRRAMLGEGGFMSAVGEYLPAEYYLSAMLALFLALATLPLSSFSASDFSASVLQRGMRTGSMRLRFLTARLLSGAVFLLLVTLLIFPAGWGATTLDRLFSGNFTALLMAMAVMTVAFSALSLGLSAWAPGGEAAVWMGFWLIMLFAMTGGVILPEGVLPGWVREAGLWSPVRAAMRLLAGTVFNFNGEQFTQDLIKMGIWGAGGAVLAVLGFMRRAAV